MVSAVLVADTGHQPHIYIRPAHGKGRQLALDEGLSQQGDLFGGTLKDHRQIDRIDRVAQYRERRFLIPKNHLYLAPIQRCEAVKEAREIQRTSQVFTDDDGQMRKGVDAVECRQVLGDRVGAENVRKVAYPGDAGLDEGHLL